MKQHEALAAAASARKELIAARRAARSAAGSSGRRGLSLMHSTDEEVEFDPEKTASENVVHALQQLVTRSGITKTKKLAYLNALVKMWERREAEDNTDGGIRLKELLLCLRIPLTHESPEVRAAGLRTIRKVINREEHAHLVSTLNVHYLITRCLDIELDNKSERIQALRLARKLLFLAPLHFPTCIARSLISIADGDYKEVDRLKKTCIAILCELSVVNSSLFISSNGVSVLTHNLLDTSMPKIAEAILGSLLRLYNDPSIRQHTDISLDTVVAPFTEFRYIHDDTPGPHTGGMSAAEVAEQEKQYRLNCAYQVTLSVLRSWPGILHMADHNWRRGISPLQSLVEVLYLDRKDVRGVVTDMFYDLLCLRVPKHCETYAEALRTVEPSFFKERWKLADGFVASEGFDLLPHLAKSRPNLIECHKSILILLLLKCKLPEALVHVIVSSSESELSIKCTMLLGEFLYLANVLLPREHNAASHCLPTLLSHVSSSDSLRSHQAAESVTALQKLHSLKKSGPVANSLFLENILTSSDSGAFQGCQFGDRVSSPVGLTFSKSSRATPTSLAGFAGGRTADERSQSNIQDSKVLVQRDASQWHWSYVAAVLRWPGDSLLRNFETPLCRQFFKKLLDFFKPTNQLFSKMELANARAKYLARIGCYLCDFLVSVNSAESLRQLEDFLTDIKNQVSLVLSTKNASSHECLFSPTRLATTACQYYFLFLGRLSRTADGRKALDSLQILQSMYELLSMRSDMYLKLVVSCLDYSCAEWGSRNLLGKALKESSTISRLYTTRFLGVLIRSKAQTITQWGIEFLVQQLFDSSKIVPWTALEILNEACDDKMNLEALICALAQKKSLDSCFQHLGVKGSILLGRFLSSQNGFRHLKQSGLIEQQLQLWAERLNVVYVHEVEDILNDGFTHHQKNEERSYGRRSYDSHAIRDVYIPSHLYGQLAASKEGLEILLKEGALTQMFQLVRESKHSSTVSNVVELKAAIWAICHLGTTPEGALILEREKAVECIAAISENCGLLSLRGTAFYALSLVATLKQGVKLLERVEWCSLKHSRDEKWPVLEDSFREQLAELNMLDANLLRELQEQRESESEAYHSTPLAEDAAGPHPRLGGDDATSNSGQSSSRASASISGRKRLSKIFRSFSLGKERAATPRLEPDARRLSARIKRRLFQNTSISQDSHAGIERDDDFEFQVSELKHEAPLAEPEDSSTPCPAAKMANGPARQVERESSSVPPRTSAEAAEAAQDIEVVVTGETERPKERTRSHTRSGQRAFSESEAQNLACGSMAAGDATSKTASMLESTLAEVPCNSVSSFGSMTLRSLHQRRRPNPREGACDQLDGSLTGGGGGGGGGEKDYLASSSLTSKLLLRRSDTWSRKSRSLDYKVLRMRPRFTTLPFSDAKQGRGDKGPLLLPLAEEASDGREPLYLGITLPLKVERLFPPAALHFPTPSGESSLCENASSTDDIENLFAVPTLVSDWLETHHHSDVASTADVDSQNLASFHGFEMHTNSNCLGCYRLTRAFAAAGDSSCRRRAESLTIPDSNSAELATASRSAVSHQGSPQARKLRRNPAAVVHLSAGSNSLAFGSTDSLGSCRSDTESQQGRAKEGAMSKVMQRKEVLQIIGILNASIGAKTAEQSLLKFKQRHPAVFTDLCLYSEVCMLMSKYFFRISSRRFIQELFMDVSFDQLYEEPHRILKMEEDGSIGSGQAQLGQLTEIASDENLTIDSNIRRQ